METAYIENAISFLWAKKSDSNEDNKWLPLLVHLKDTMNVAGWLWNHWISEGQRAYIISQMNGSNGILAENLVRFLGGIHDIGKATPVFQTQKSFSSESLQNILLDKLEKAGFTGISTLILASPKDTKHALAGEFILKQLGVRSDIASIIGSHHGRPTDDTVMIENQEYYPFNYYQSENSSERIYQLWENSRKNILQWTLDESELYNVESLPSFSVPAQVLLSGILIMADWISSNEAYFPLISIYENKVDDTQRFSNGIQKWFKNYSFSFNKPNNANELYFKRFGFFPRDFQEIIFNTVKNIKNPGIIIVEAPTGCGKTEAALVTAEQLAAETGRAGLFFGLPTQATSNGIFPRIKDWLSTITKEYGNASLRLVHGKAALNPVMQSITVSSHMAEDLGNNETILVNEWFSGRKKTSLDDFVVGTVDNFLMVSLKQKHLALRHLGFDKKIIVIDEVHAYDAYMQQYLSESVRWMGAYGVPVILLSATLPADIRVGLIESYLSGKGVKKRNIDRCGIELNSEKYPLLTYTDDNSILQNSSFPEEESKEIRIIKLDETVVLEKIKELIKHGGILGIIVNTVKRAQEIARKCIELFGEGMVELLHAGFISADRIQREEYLQNIIGKNARRPTKKIIVGTQVIEQSLDIDFDVLITDLCPMDLLIQRIGRLHRHKIKRPEQHHKPTAYVIGTNENFVFEQGAEHIYGTYLLIRTQMYLKTVIRIPEDVSELVQKVYGSNDGKSWMLSAEMEEKYKRSREKFIQDINDKAEKAKTFRISRPSLKIEPDRYNLTGWLRDPNNSVSEEEAAAQVRDIQETIEVIAVRAYGSKYGLFNARNAQDVNISDYLGDIESCRVLAGQTLRLPVAVNRLSGGTHSVVEFLEKYNSVKLREWQSKPWLKGSLGIVFDENQTFMIRNVELHYDKIYGLMVSYHEKEKNGTI